VFRWKLDRVLVMGIVNVTPDSFSGDGLLDPDAAVEHGLRLVDEGADLLDVGGESTRPGHEPVEAAEEAGRVLPVVERLSREAGVPISIDTSKLGVARAAADSGALIVNDVWGLRRDRGIAALAAERGLGLVLMHNQDGTAYRDLVPDVVASLSESLGAALEAGVDRDQVVLDPGLGFGKTGAQTLEVLRRLPEVGALGRPVLVGPSRKSFLGRLFGLEGDDRAAGTAGAVAAAVLRGAAIVRVHDVRLMAAVARVAEALR
jgi:dihydropteroate synthase